MPGNCTSGRCTRVRCIPARCKPARCMAGRCTPARFTPENCIIVKYICCGCINCKMHLMSGFCDFDFQKFWSFDPKLPNRPPYKIPHTPRHEYERSSASEVSRCREAEDDGPGQIRAIDCGGPSTETF